MKTMVAVPCMDMMHSDFVVSLTGLQHDGDVTFVYSKSSLVYDSRNGLANQAIKGGFDAVLWIDSDMTFLPDTYFRLREDLEAGADMVCGIYTTRRPPVKPAIFSQIGYTLHEDGTAETVAKSFLEYPKNALFEIDACGFGCVLTKTALLREVKEKYGLPFSPVLGFGEDISFCLRVKELGKKIYCDSRIKLGHIGFVSYTEADLHG